MKIPGFLHYRHLLMSADGECQYGAWYLQVQWVYLIILNQLRHN